MSIAAHPRAKSDRDTVPLPLSAPAVRARGQRRGRVLVVAAIVTLALVAGFIADLRVQPGGELATRTVDDLAQLVAAGAMAVAGFVRALRVRDRLRTSWLLVAMGGASWCLGQCVWSYYELIGSTQTPFPSLADAGYLLFPLLSMIGLLVRPSQAFASRGRVRVALDVLLVLAAVLTISWTTALGGVYRSDAGWGFGRVVSLAYPLADVALLTVVLSVMSSARGAGRLGVLFLGGGLAAFAFADSGFALLIARGDYQTGNLVDAGWVIGFLVLGWAAVLDRPHERGQHLRGTRHGHILPYVPSLIALVLAIWRLAPSSADRLLLTTCTVMVAVLIARQIVVVGDNSRLAEDMRYQAYHDALTGLANRALFQDHLESALRRHTGDRRPMSVLLIDLDNFKLINDSLGHPAGDELLTEVSRRFTSVMRAGDTVARIGGDEFGVLVQQTAERSDAEVVAAKIVDALARPFPVNGLTLFVGASVGVTLFPEAGDTYDSVVSRADSAMYRAKAEGRGRFQMCEPPTARG